MFFCMSSDSYVQPPNDREQGLVFKRQKIKTKLVVLVVPFRNFYFIIAKLLINGLAERGMLLRIQPRLHNLGRQGNETKVVKVNKSSLQ